MGISYNGRNWWQNAFAWSGTALPLCYFRIAIATLYCICILLISRLGIHQGWFTEGVTDESTVDAFGHSVLGSLIGFLLVFRMNASNARFWEGRSLWGTIINASRNLVRAGSEHTRDGEELADLTAGFAICLKCSLRGSRDLEEAAPFLPESLMQSAEKFGNQPTAVAAAMTEWVARHSRSGQLDPEMTRHLESQIAVLVDAQGGCEKIQKTPLPFAYVSMIKLLILVYLATLPLVLSDRFGWWAPMLMAVLSLGMFGIEEASVDIEDPFGRNANCIDLDTLTLTVTRDTGQLARFATARWAAEDAAEGDNSDTSVS